jgi:hypothetical protein
MGSTPGATPGATASYNPAAAGPPGAYTPYDPHVYNGHPTTPGGEDGTPGYAHCPPHPAARPDSGRSQDATVSPILQLGGWSHLRALKGKPMLSDDIHTLHKLSHRFLGPPHHHCYVAPTARPTLMRVCVGVCVCVSGGYAMMDCRYSQGTTASGDPIEGMDRGYTPSDVQYSPTSPSVNDGSLAPTPSMSPLSASASAASEPWPVVGLVVKLPAGETGVVCAPITLLQCPG